MLTLCSGLGYKLAGVTTTMLNKRVNAEDTAKNISLFSSMQLASLLQNLQTEFWCYCDCDISQSAPPEPKANCTEGATRAGKKGQLAVYETSPHNPPLPTKLCPGGTVDPSATACIDNITKNLPFCDTQLSLDVRVSDLVKRFTLQEAGPLLTARESPSIPRLGIPAFYWGTNAIHGVRVDVCVNAAGDQKFRKYQILTVFWITFSTFKYTHPDDDIQSLFGLFRS